MPVFSWRDRHHSGELWMCLTPPACRRRRRRAGGTTWVYVRCDCERLRYDLKNPSTSVDAESLALNGTTDALTRRWSARAASGRQKTYSHHPPTPPYRLSTTSSRLWSVDSFQHSSTIIKVLLTFYVVGWCNAERPGLKDVLL